MHPLTPTRLPLKEFCALYARQLAEAGAKNPLRIQRRPLPLRDMIHAGYATYRYHRAFRDLYRDYPRELWG